MWNNDIPSIVFTKMKLYTSKKLNERYPNKYNSTNYTRQSRSQTNAKFPTIMFKGLQGAETGADLNGDTVNVVISYFQIDVITNTSQTDAYNIADVVMEAMKTMRYQLVGDLIIDDSGESTYRVISRYRRLIGHDDVL